MDPRAVICLCLWLFVGQVQGSHIPLKMNQTIQRLLQRYKIPAKERYNGKPVFSREPLSERMEANKLFMGGILDTYDKLIGQMLGQLPTPSPHVAVSLNPGASDPDNSSPDDTMRKDLIFIRTKVGNLKKNFYSEAQKQYLRFLKDLQDLQDIKTDNYVVQSKALGELNWLYEEASEIVKDDRARRRRRRRRRHTQKAKNQARSEKQ